MRWRRMLDSWMFRRLFLETRPAVTNRAGLATGSERKKIFYARLIFL